MLFVAWPSFAADPNGYTAQYECRAGGQYCNVDVTALGSRADLCERRHPCGAPTVNSTLPLQDKAWYRNLPSLPLWGITSSFSYVNWNQQQESSS